MIEQYHYWQHAPVKDDKCKEYEEGNTDRKEVV